jgi:hypothetical protein
MVRARHPGPHGRLRATLLAAVLGLATLGFSPQAVADEGTKVAPPVAATEHPRDKTFMKRMWGIDVQYVRRTAGGYMLEFRYQVLDPAKAATLFDRQEKPVLVHDETGSRFTVPTPGKVGALRNSNAPKKGQVYWMLFANPGAYVKTGDHVTIEIGDFSAGGLVVR